MRGLCRPDHGKDEIKPPSSLNRKHRTEEHYTDGPCPDGAISTSHRDYGSEKVPIGHENHPNNGADENVAVHSVSVNTSTYETNLDVPITVEDASGTVGSVVFSETGGAGPDPCTSTGAVDNRTKRTKESIDD